MATRLEAHPWTGERAPLAGPFPVYELDDFLLIISGMGKGRAALAVSHARYRHGIERFLNLGAAGALDENLSTGEVFQADRVCEYDRPRLPDMEDRFFTPDLLEGHRNAPLATRDVPTVSADERRMVSRVARMVDMEGAGFMQACSILGCRGSLFKIITDTPGDDDQVSIVRRVKETRETLYHYFLDRIVPSLEENQ
jgi:nucleoside phosphorylase